MKMFGEWWTEAPLSDNYETALREIRQAINDEDVWAEVGDFFACGLHPDIDRRFTSKQLLHVRFQLSHVRLIVYHCRPAANPVLFFNSL
jgi:hypothetical protein